MVLREREVEEVEVKVKVEVRRKAGFYCRSRSLLIGGGGRVGGLRRGRRGRRAPRRGGCWGANGWLSPINVGAEARGRTAERVEGDESFHERKF
jgi:hypothetical protein